MCSSEGIVPRGVSSLGEGFCVHSVLSAAEGLPDDGALADIWWVVSQSGLCTMKKLFVLDGA